ncbi:MAG TPA: hypothetical protein VKU00_01660 [Chthonomonadaceae bacterium]|nr:hypothetical protein [Chthonomonadaceae bacterium]
MRQEEIGTTPGAQDRAAETGAMPDGPTASYEVRLRLSGLPAGEAEEVQATIRAALAASVPDGLVTVEGVEERQPARDGGWVEERITPLFVLFCTLPAEFQRPGILAELAENYHRELACLWRTARDGRCVQAAIEVRPWRRAGGQWICEFLSYDKGAPLADEFNWYMQNTSQWSNQETGWAGHQGAIVLNSHDGHITAHH